MRMRYKPDPRYFMTVGRRVLDRYETQGAARPHWGWRRRDPMARWLSRGCWDVGNLTSDLHVEDEHPGMIEIDSHPIN